MRVFKWAIFALLFFVGFVLLISESDNVGAFVVSKGLSVVCACAFYLLWKAWNMDDDDFVKRMTKDD